MDDDEVGAVDQGRQVLLGEAGGAQRRIGGLKRLERGLAVIVQQVAQRPRSMRLQDRHGVAARLQPAHDAA